MSLDRLKEKIQKSGSNWEKLGINKRRSLNPEYIYCRFTQSEGKRGNTVNKLSISIGDKVAELFDLKANDRLTVFSNKNDNNSFLLKRDEEGHKLYNIKVDFDIHDDNSIVINLIKKE